MGRGLTLVKGNGVPDKERSVADWNRGEFAGCHHGYLHVGVREKHRAKAAKGQAKLLLLSRHCSGSWRGES